jgi:predicted AAA+ superfamily ATPase
MYYNRIAEALTTEYLKLFRVVGIMGPRQSGKTTMIRHLLSDSYQYITFDRLENRELFNNDPVRFIQQYNRHIVFDEVQQVPNLFPMIKTIADENQDDRGRFVLTGSVQFLLSKNISESLAGRIGLISLLPMQYFETPTPYQSRFIASGGYPEIATGNFTNPAVYFDSYLNTYLQKDLRSLLNVTDLNAFTQFIRLLAARVSQTLNLSGISKEIGITVSTLSKWVSVLEASYIILLLHPYHNNLGKRIIKTPKVYFYDNGLLTFLTGIRTYDQLQTGVLYGPIFENLIISEVRKSMLHHGTFASLFFIRTSHDDEIDLVIDFGNSVKVIEIKASHTYKSHYHKALNKLSEKTWSKHIVYQGETTQVVQDIKAWNYRDFFQTDFKAL